MEQDLKDYFNPPEIKKFRKEIKERYMEKDKLEEQGSAKEISKAKLIPTAAEFFRNCMFPIQSTYTKEQRIFIARAIKFVELHTQAALEAAAENVHVIFKNPKGDVRKSFPFRMEYDVHLDKESILNAYPEDKII